MFDVFGWLRHKTKEAFLAGLADGLAEVQDAPAVGETLALLRNRLEPLALPSPAVQETAAGKRGRKGD